MFFVLFCLAAFLAGRRALGQVEYNENKRENRDVKDGAARKSKKTL